MRVWTSYFGNTRLPHGLPLVSIAGKAPEGWLEAGNAEYSKLAPKWEWWKRWRDEGLSESWYIGKYVETVLSKLDAEKTLDELKAAAGGADELCLMCYERPEEGWFCHRQIVRGWINDYYRSKGVRGWASWEWREGGLKAGERPTFAQMDLL